MPQPIAIGGTGQANAAAMVRSSRFSSRVTLPSAAIEAVTAVMICRLTLGLAWANSARAASKARSVHCCRGSHGGLAQEVPGAGLERPLDLVRLLLAEVGQRGEDDRRRPATAPAVR